MASFVLFCSVQDPEYRMDSFVLFCSVQDPEYRMASFVWSKMMESIVKDNLMVHLDRNKLINKSQHGFMKNRSFTTNLLEFMEVITEAADSGNSFNDFLMSF